MDFFQHQERARRKTGLLVLYFILAVIAIVVCVNLALLLTLFWGNVQIVHAHQWLAHPIVHWVTGLTLAVMIFGCLIKLWQLRNGGKGLADMLGARHIPMDSVDISEKKLINVVEEMSIASGIPAPQLYVLDKESGINAFVAGFRPSETVLVVTQGTLNELNRDELQGVIAHEFSHIFNADMRLNLRLLAVLAGILALGKVGEYLIRGQRRSSSNRKGGGGLVFAGLALMVVGYVGLFFGRLIKAAISRQRELLADASAVQFTRNPAGIGGALIKIRNGNGSHLTSPHAEDMSHMCFGETLRFRWRNLLGTHPPLDERLRALGSDWVARARSRARNTLSTATHSNPEIPQGASAFAGGSLKPTRNENPPAAPSQRIGTVSEPDMGYARSLLETIPDDLRRQTRSPKSAENVLYALILSASNSSTEALLAALDITGQRPALVTLSKQIHAQGSRLRLPLIDLALPALKPLPATDRARILTHLTALIEVDDRYSFFEWALVGLARQQLGDQSGKNRRTRFRRYGALAAELQLLFSVLTWASGADEKDARTLFQLSTHGLLPAGRTLLPLTHCGSHKLSNAIERLADLSPLLKGPVIDAAADLVLADGKVQVQEAELLRAVSALLECPLPPLFNR
ncbi:MAG: protease [Alcanivorax borkumensis]|jgi:Zn-dependent protease with chaperone function|uniref:Protease, putative n=1 Tax=Alcanivorax borkumensis (strain ATCC 700651 / DSM 11573 / NCIMB 13689 / SK2) TaxID=393595 RepID=Q0VN91_ALCBS|nr:M48 family metallopeptidase [Alcanivorax borkumensis]OJH07098.1 MAG: protease [Alcanivorax borkumensis]CAL17357.1 protease, putative [Alcanivorax borkumensis SK2]